MMADGDGGDGDDNNDMCSEGGTMNVFMCSCRSG